MTKNRMKKIYQSGIFLACLSMSAVAYGRVGGAGGHGGFGGGHGGGYGGGGGFGYGGGGGMSAPVIIIIIILVVAYQLYMNSQKGKNDPGPGEVPQPQQKLPFPEGLNANKVATSFYAIQDAWQHKDLKNVRKWLSDGMYQRLTTQFKMMDILGQRNELNNIRIHDIYVSDTHTDGDYQTAEVAIYFSMDDSFISDKYSQFNESYEGDSDIEYWTFIKRTDAVGEKNLYDNNNCPNCGAPFEVKMGEISRCANCNTLTNSAAYDWVLSEITQRLDYSGGAGLADDAGLKELMKGDPFFAVQRMEDIASNVCMQVLDVLSIDDRKKLTRFADDSTTDKIMGYKQNLRPFVFDRLYLNSVTLSSYREDNDMVNLYFNIRATYRRVSIEGRLTMLDNDFVTTPITLVLSRNKSVFRAPNAAETVYSYECSSCGAPYTDTTEDHCTYCDAPVIDKQRNWVLTDFLWS